MQYRATKIVTPQKVIKHKDLLGRVGFTRRVAATVAEQSATWQVS